MLQYLIQSCRKQIANRLVFAYEIVACDSQTGLSLNHQTLRKYMDKRIVH